MVTSGLGLSVHYLAENGTPREFGGEVVQVRDRVQILGCGIVETPIVSARTPSTVFLGNHMQTRAPRGTRPPADACRTHQPKVLLRHL